MLLADDVLIRIPRHFGSQCPAPRAPRDTTPNLALAGPAENFAAHLTLRSRLVIVVAHNTPARLAHIHFNRYRLLHSSSMTIVPLSFLAMKARNLFSAAMHRSYSFAAFVIRPVSLHWMM